MSGQPGKASPAGRPAKVRRVPRFPPGSLVRLRSRPHGEPGLVVRLRRGQVLVE